MQWELLVCVVTEGGIEYNWWFYCFGDLILFNTCTLHYRFCSWFSKYLSIWVLVIPIYFYFKIFYKCIVSLYVLFFCLFKNFLVVSLVCLLSFPFPSKSGIIYLLMWFMFTKFKYWTVQTVSPIFQLFVFY